MHCLWSRLMQDGLSPWSMGHSGDAAPVVPLQDLPQRPGPRQHSALIWFALCSKAKQYTVSCGYDRMPVSRGYMRAQYP